MIFVFAWPYFSPVPLHRDYLLRLCARDGIASSIIIIIIRRFASSLFAGCGWLWWVVALTHALHRPSSTPSFGRFWGFWDEFGAPPFFSSFCHYRCLSSFFARHLSSSLRGLSPLRFVIAAEEAAALEGPQIKLGEPWSQLGGPQSQLVGSQSLL